MNIGVAVRFVRAFAKGSDTITKSSRLILPLVSTARIVAAMLFGGAVSTVFAAAEAAAIDTEPLNNSQLTADSLPTLLPGTAASNFARLEDAGGDVDFFKRRWPPARCYWAWCRR